jgi:hypothetical protein
VDGTTLEANAALRSIVRRDNGQSYDDFLKGLAKESGIETPTREQLAKPDRKRKKKGNNDDWKNPHDPDAQITKMKDGRTHLAHKAEHAVDPETGAVLAVALHPATAGDPAGTISSPILRVDNRYLSFQQFPEGPLLRIADTRSTSHYFHIHASLPTGDDLYVYTVRLLSNLAGPARAVRLSVHFF